MIKLLKTIIAILGVSLLVIGHVGAAAQVTFYHHDALGSVIAKSDENGSLYLNEEYQPYGEKVYGTEDSFGDSEDWYTGKNYSEELDLTYFGARWYDAKQGRFLSIDPAPVLLTSIHTFNRYHYANNNPYRYLDPDGEQAIDSDDLDEGGVSGFDTDEGDGGISVGGGPQTRYVDGIKVYGISGVGAGGAGGVRAKSPGQLGREGEATASAITGVGKNNTVFPVNGRNRIPDQVNGPQHLTEVKNVSYLSYTRQLRDNVDLVGGLGGGGRVDVFVRGNGNSRISGPLRQQHDNPESPINIREEL